MTTQTYYAVMLNNDKTRTSEKVSVEEFTKRGYTVSPSRRKDSDALNVYREGIPVARLYKT